MGPQEITCRLCLKICNHFKAFEGNTKEFLDKLLPKANFAAVQTPVICTNCAEVLRQCFDFKVMCFSARDNSIPFVNKNNAKLNLADNSLSSNENDTDVQEDICDFCISPVKSCSPISLYGEKGGVMLEKMIEQQCLPKLDLSTTKKPVICTPCHGSLEMCFHFVTNCLSVEEKIKKYCETLNINYADQIDLSSLLQLTIRDVTEEEVDGKSVDIIEVEKLFCERRENADERVVGNEGEMVKLEQILSGDGESIKEEIESEDKSYMVDMNDLKFNYEKQFAPNNILPYKEESNNLNVIKTEETFCEENEIIKKNLVEMEGQKLLSNEEIKIKTNVTDFCRSEDGVVFPHLEVTTGLHRSQKHLMPDLKEDLTKPSLKDTSNKKHALKTRMHQCEFCSFHTKYKYNLKVHQLIHKDSSEVPMYKCDSCVYQTKSIRVMKKHFIVHKDPSEVTMYKCDSCSYQTKYNASLKNHLQRHREVVTPAEVTTYKCDFCPFETISTTYLKRHLLVHVDPSEVTMYKCDSCSFQTKRKWYLKTHSRVHKDSSEVAMHQCNYCTFQTRSSLYLKRHLLVHKTLSEVTMYKCDSCSYQTIHKYRFKEHLQRHEARSEAATYKCDYCPFQTKSIIYLKRHLLVHKDPSEVPMYKCDSCSFQTKYAINIKRHLVLHMDPSEVTMYKCDSCAFQTKHRDGLKKHFLMVHKDPSELTMYKCDSCSYQTKRRRYLKEHFSRLHKSPSLSVIEDSSKVAV